MSLRILPPPPPPPPPPIPLQLPSRADARFSSGSALYQTRENSNSSSRHWRYSSRRLALLFCWREGILTKITLLAKSGEQNHRRTNSLNLRGTGGGGRAIFFIELIKKLMYKSHATCTCLLYDRLSPTLTRANARALLSRAGPD